MKVDTKKIKFFLEEINKTTELNKNQFCIENNITNDEFDFLISLNEEIKKHKSMINNEGVIEKFIEKDPYLQGLPRDFEKFEREYNPTDGEVFFTRGNWKLIKNPKTLEGFSPYVRGVITINGDFYLEQKPEGFIHNDIIDVLKEKHIVPDVGRKWGSMLPENSGFLTVQRFYKDNLIAIGESNKIIYKIEDWEKYRPKYMEILNKVKQASPGINFTYKLIGSRGFVINKGENFLVRPNEN